MNIEMRRTARLEGLDPSDIERIRRGESGYGRKDARKTSKGVVVHPDIDFIMRTSRSALLAQNSELYDL